MSDDFWGASQDAWDEVNRVEVIDDDLYKWQEMVLRELQEITNKENAQSEVSQATREAQLTAIVANHKEIPLKARRTIVQTLLADMFSFGALQPLWSRSEVSDMQVFVPVDGREKQIITYSSAIEGRRIWNGSGFRDYSHVMTWLNRHLAQYGQHYDAAKVSMDAMFPNGERMHIITGVSGYSIFRDGNYKYVPCVIITMRRFTSAFTTADLTARAQAVTEPPQFPALRQVRREYQRRKQYFTYDGRSLDPATMDYLRVMVQLAKNHIISGGTGSGKSTLANALTAEIPNGTVLIVLEEAPELQPQNDTHVIRVVQREGVFDLADAMKAALRMYPDRVFIAELRDTLAFTFLRAIQSGHDGSSTTVHANTALDTIDVVTNFAANHESHPPREMVRDIIFRRVHTIIHAEAIKKPNGIARMIDEVVQLLPDQTLHAVMRFHQVGINKDGSLAGYFEFFGPDDNFIQEMFDRGIALPDSWGWTV